MKNNVLITGQVVNKKVYGNARDKTMLLTIMVKSTNREFYPVVKIEGHLVEEAIKEIRVKDWIGIKGKFTKYRKKTSGRFIEEIVCTEYLCHSLYISPGMYRNEVCIGGIVKGLYKLADGITSVTLETVLNTKQEKVISLTMDIYKSIDKVKLKQGDQIEVDAYISTRYTKDNKWEQHIVLLRYNKTKFPEEELACSRVIPQIQKEDTWIKPDSKLLPSDSVTLSITDKATSKDFSSHTVFSTYSSDD